MSFCRIYKEVCGIRIPPKVESLLKVCFLIYNVVELVSEGVYSTYPIPWFTSATLPYAHEHVSRNDKLFGDFILVLDSG